MRRRRPPRQRGSPPCNQEAGDVAEVMPGIGQERGGIADDAEYGLDDDKEGVERNSECKSRSECLGRVAMARAKRMAMTRAVRVSGVTMGGSVLMGVVGHSRNPCLPRLSCGGPT